MPLQAVMQIAYATKAHKHTMCWNSELFREHTTITNGPGWGSWTSSDILLMGNSATGFKIETTLHSFSLIISMEYQAAPCSGVL